MFKINRKIEYALIALKHMSHKSPGQLTSAKEICDIYKTPFDPTSRVLQIMTQQEILQAEQGAKGGYQIIRDLTKLSLCDLSLMIVGPIEIANCFHGEYSCCEINHTCHIISPMLSLNENINKLFSSISIGELLESKHSKEKNIRSKKQSLEGANS
ncbi:MAG: Rrf2 family transcriptional regulator [Candidatus Omnitrophota bacterium]